MAKVWILDKIIKPGVVYETPKRVGYVINKIGTNSSGTAKLKIYGRDLGEFDADVAPLRKTETNLLGPLDLEDLYYVVPPETKFEFVGDSGSLCRIIGSIIMLDVGEGFPGEYMTRFGKQQKVHKQLYTGTFSLATDEVWKKDEEYEVFSITPLTTEKVTFKDIVMISVSGGTVNEGDFGVIFKFGNVPFELDVAKNLHLGINIKSMPLPPKDSVEIEPFTLKNSPIEVPGDQTLSIFVRNVSGADKSPASGSAWTVTLKAIGVYERVE